MSRIAGRLASLKKSGRKALVPYIVAGDPVPSATVLTMHALVEHGADMIELGVPFSDPMAEGPTIQLGHERSLSHGTTLKAVLEMVAEFRQKDQQTPVLLMGYANPIEAMGYAYFATAAQSAGVDGVLTVDLPPEEAQGLNDELKKVSIDNIFLLAPTTTMERAKKICSIGSGFLYYVALKGVTGAGNLDIDSVAQKLSQIRALTQLPLCVGFGIKDAQSASQVAAVADGAVVGSVLVAKMAEMTDGTFETEGLSRSNFSDQQIADQVAAVIGKMRMAIDT